MIKLGTFGIHVALYRMDQACESIDKAICAIDSFRQRPDIKLLDIAVDYLKEAGSSGPTWKHIKSPSTIATGRAAQLESINTPSVP